MKKRLGGVLLGLALLLTACVSGEASIEAERSVHRQLLAEPETAPFETGPTDWVVVADGAIQGRGATLDDALRDAGEDESRHRFVFQEPDLAPLSVNLAFLPEGGRAAGRGLVAALGLTLTQGATGTVTLEHSGKRVRLTVDNARQLRVRVATPDGSQHQDLDIPFDPDFGGHLLLDGGLARTLQLERFERPGEGTVHVALGRPFNTRRSTVRISIPALGVEGLVEAFHPRWDPSKP